MTLEIGNGGGGAAILGGRTKHVLPVTSSGINIKKILTSYRTGASNC